MFEPVAVGDRGLVPRRQVLKLLGATAGWLALAPALRAVAEPTEVVIDAPIDGRDATDIIMRQIDAAPDGSIIRFPIGRADGRYRVDGRLWVQDRANLTIVGPSATNRATIWTDKVGQDVGIINQNGYSHRSHWSFRDCHGITVQNLRVDGPNARRDDEGYSQITLEQEGEHGFVFNMCSDMQLIDCVANSVYGDGCWIHAPAGYKTTNVTVRRFKTRSNGRHGMGIFNVDGVAVDGLTVVKGGTCGIDMEPNGPEDSTLNVEIRNCDIDTRTVAFAAMGAKEVSGVWLHDNVVKHAKTWPMLGVKRRDGGLSRDWVVENNRQIFRISPGSGLSFTAVENVVVRNNYIELGNREWIEGVRLVDCKGRLEVTNNDFTGAGAAFLREGSTGSVTAYGNTCSGCG